jgi:putative transposase
MRSARIKLDAGYYHCMSRVIERRMIFGDAEKERFRKLMRKISDFSGVKILTYSIMTTHFHLLTHVPEPVSISDRELIRRLRLLYSKRQVDDYATSLCAARSAGNEVEAERLRAKYTYRMNDVSEFMKSLKQRFSMSYNARHKRRGTLWEERFKSVLVEGTENALVMMATYIDLNAVRAGMVNDPKEYRYCGYGEAVGGSKVAREGLGGVMLSFDAGVAVWGQISHRYRRLLYSRGVRTAGKGGFSVEAIEKVLDEGGALSRGDLLRCRVRYFSDGVVLGSQEFVEDIYSQYRDEFGRKRKTGARAMRHGDWGGLCTMRDLRLKVVTVPG